MKSIDYCQALGSFPNKIRTRSRHFNQKHHPIPRQIGLDAFRMFLFNDYYFQQNDHEL